MDRAESFEIEFSSELSARDRRIVHLVGEKLRLIHESRGENEARCIHVGRACKGGGNEEVTEKLKFDSLA